MVVGTTWAIEAGGAVVLVIVFRRERGRQPASACGPRCDDRDHDLVCEELDKVLHKHNQGECLGARGEKMRSASSEIEQGQYRKSCSASGKGMAAQACLHVKSNLSACFLMSFAPASSMSLMSRSRPDLSMSPISCSISLSYVFFFFKGGGDDTIRSVQDNIRRKRTGSRIAFTCSLHSSISRSSSAYKTCFAPRWTMSK